MKCRHYDDAQRILAAYSIAVIPRGDHAGVFIQSQSPQVDNVFERTRWADGGWKRALKALPGARGTENAVWVPSFNKPARGIILPIKLVPQAIPVEGLFGDDADPNERE